MRLGESLGVRRSWFQGNQLSVWTESWGTGGNTYTAAWGSQGGEDYLFVVGILLQAYKHPRSWDLQGTNRGIIDLSKYRNIEKEWRRKRPACQMQNER